MAVRSMADVRSECDIRAQLGLRPIINASGTMTALGASIVVSDAVSAVSSVLSEFVEISDLHRAASKVVAQLCAAEAGFITASASAGITLTIAGAMTGNDLAAIERLPDSSKFANEVPIQIGHMVGYGAPVEQAIRLSGARVVPFGNATEVRAYQLAGAITEKTAAVLYVVSHHTVQYGQLSLEQVVEVAHARDVPVIVDAASEYDLRGFLARGADVAIYSAHKFLGGPTAGIVAGRKDLVRAAYLQNAGIGRGMKVGKEGIVGAIAALTAWEKRDHAAARAREASNLSLWQERLSHLNGISVRAVPDPTNNPLDRLLVQVDAAIARITAWDLADALASGNPPVIVRDHEVEHGYFFLDPCNLHPGEEVVVADRIGAELERARSANAPAATSIAERSRRRFESMTRWPD